MVSRGSTGQRVRLPRDLRTADPAAATPDPRPGDGHNEFPEATATPGNTPTLTPNSASLLVLASQLLSGGAVAGFPFERDSARLPRVMQLRPAGERAASPLAGTGLNAGTLLPPRWWGDGGPRGAGGRHRRRIPAPEGALAGSSDRAYEAGTWLVQRRYRLGRRLPGCAARDLARRRRHGCGEMHDDLGGHDSRGTGRAQGQDCFAVGDRAC
jgi:hypothetical protein